MKRIIFLLAVLVLSHSVVCGQENDDYFSFYYDFTGLVPNVGDVQPTIRIDGTILTYTYEQNSSKNPIQSPDTILVTTFREASVDLILTLIHDFKDSTIYERNPCIWKEGRHNMTISYKGDTTRFILDNTFHRTALKIIEIVNLYLPEDKKIWATEQDIIDCELCWAVINKEWEKVVEPEDKNDISKLWIKQVEILSSSKELDLDSVNLNNLDISSILEYNDSTNYETPGYFCTYMGALGENFERIDFHFYSARKVKNQDYALKILMRKGGVIDTLIGDLKLIKALDAPEFIEGTNFMLFLYDFNFKSQNPEDGVTIKGTSSITFLMENGIAFNFWSASGDYSEYIRTFVGYYMDSKSDKKLNCIFALKVAGLYSYLPFCDDFYDHEIYDSPDYYHIKDKYKQFGWQDFNERDPDKYDWWKK